MKNMSRNTRIALGAGAGAAALLLAVAIPYLALSYSLRTLNTLDDDAFDDEDDWF